MSSVNKAIIIGHLGQDPELRNAGSSQVCTFSVATSESWTDKQGQKQERTEWHRVQAWGKLADICGTYLSKGRQVYVEGSIHTREWQDKDGQRRWTTEIKAHSVQFLGGKGDGGQRSEGSGYRPPQGAQGGPGGDFSDEDIPF